MYSSDNRKSFPPTRGCSCPGQVAKKPTTKKETSNRAFFFRSPNKFFPWGPGQAFEQDTTFVAVKRGKEKAHGEQPGPRGAKARRDAGKEKKKKRGERERIVLRPRLISHYVFPGYLKKNYAPISSPFFRSSWSVSVPGQRPIPRQRTSL